MRPSCRHYSGPVSRCRPHTGQKPAYYLAENNDHGHIHTGIHDKGLIDTGHANPISPSGPVHKEPAKNDHDQSDHKAPGKSRTIVDHLRDQCIILEWESLSDPLAGISQKAFHQVIQKIHDHIIQHPGIDHLTDTQLSF